MIAADYGYSCQVNAGPGSCTNNNRALQVMKGGETTDAAMRKACLKLISAVITFIPKLLKTMSFYSAV